MGRQNINPIPEDFSQNNFLPIRVVSPDFGHLTPEAAAKYGNVQQLPYYFFLFLLDGNSTHETDTEVFEIGKHEMLFFLPNQTRRIENAAHGNTYYKLGFYEDCLAQLPRQYPFLVNPLRQHKICFSAIAAQRVEAIFKILLDLLRTAGSAPDLILAHLNSLLTEINTAYFASAERPAEAGLSKFMKFSLFVETNLTRHPTVTDVARELAVSTDNLYQVVKQHSGLSPKEFIINRLIMEARRRIHYGERTSVKELAFDLGFNDPAYFSRLFKKVTGKSVGGFLQDLS